MLRFPNCKINLGLYVTRKRDDGYHELETVFYPLTRRAGRPTISGTSLLDSLEVVPAAETRLNLSGLSVSGNDRDNLVWKAYDLLLELFPAKVPPLDIYLHKVIPMGAGLGGGSADGSCMLRLLNDYCGLGLSAAELIALALRLGSDCPFFIHNAPCFATGRGEQMTPIDIDLSAYSIQVICPQVHVSTGAAFSMLTPAAAAFDLRLLSGLPVAQWKGRVSNDFEDPVFKRHSALADIKNQLYDQGAVYASMSGSGSAIFGIFPPALKATIAPPVAFSEFYIA